MSDIYHLILEELMPPNLPPQPANDNKKLLSNDNVHPDEPLRLEYAVKYGFPA
jgi:hypothetical protein